MYIQDKVEEYADEIFDLLEKGAHIYFCGLKGMMPGARLCQLSSAGRIPAWPAPSAQYALLTRRPARPRRRQTFAVAAGQHLHKKPSRRSAGRAGAAMPHPLTGLAAAGINSMLEEVCATKGMDYSQFAKSLKEKVRAPF